MLPIAPQGAVIGHPRLRNLIRFSPLIPPVVLDVQKTLCFQWFRDLTRWTQNPVLARECGFDSLLRHPRQNHCFTFPQWKRPLVFFLNWPLFPVIQFPRHMGHTTTLALPMGPGHGRIRHVLRRPPPPGNRPLPVNHALLREHWSIGCAFHWSK